MKSIFAIGLCMLGLMVPSIFADSIVKKRAWEDSIFQLQKSGFPFAYYDSISNKIERGSAWVWSDVVRLNQGKTTPLVVRNLGRSVGVYSGAVVDLTALQRVQQELQQQAWIASVESVQLFRKENRNVLIPAISFTERESNFFDGWLYYSEGQWQGQLQLELLNILGTAREFQIQLLRNENLREVSATIKEPYLLNSTLSLVGEARYSQLDSTEEYMDFQGLAILPQGGWDVGLGYQWIGTLQNKQWSEQQLLKGLLSVDYRNNSLYPSSGWYSQLQGGVGERRFEDSSTVVANFEWDMEFYQPLFMQFWGGNTYASVRGLNYGSFPNDSLTITGKAKAELRSLGLKEFWGIWPGSQRVYAMQYAKWALNFAQKQLNLALVLETGRVFKVESHKQQAEYLLNYGFEMQLLQKGPGVRVRLGWNHGAPWKDGILGVGVQRSW